jgi:hypothetical protein
MLLFGGNSAVPKREHCNNANGTLNGLGSSPPVPSHKPTRTQGRLIGDNSHLHLLTLFDKTVPVVRMRRKLPRNFCKQNPTSAQSCHTAAAVAFEDIRSDSNENDSLFK